MPQILNINQADFEAQFQALLSAKREDSPDVDATVADIISDVRARGDAAVIGLTSKFDRLDLAPDTLAFPAKRFWPIALRFRLKSVPLWNWLQSASARIMPGKCRKMPIG